MKKLILSLVLVVILLCTFTTSVFAWPPSNQPADEADNGLERVFQGDGNDQSFQGMLQGLIAPVWRGKCPNAWFGPIVAYWTIQNWGY